MDISKLSWSCFTGFHVGVEYTHPIWDIKIKSCAEAHCSCSCHTKAHYALGNG